MSRPDSGARIARYRSLHDPQRHSPHDDAPPQLPSRTLAPQAMAAAMRRLNAGEASFADTVEAFRALGLTTHQATVAVSVHIASQQPHAAPPWRTRRRKRFSPPRW